MNATEKIVCPSCGSENVVSNREQRQLSLPFAPGASYAAVLDRCEDCEFEGDFANSNDAALQRALADAKRASVSAMLGHLDGKGYSMAYMERALELPIRTMMRWKNGDFSAGALALLRMIATFPWVIEVADAHFDQVFATKKLAHEGFSAICKIAESKNVSAWLDVSQFDRNVIHGAFQIRRTTTAQSPATLGFENTNANSPGAFELSPVKG